MKVTMEYAAKILCRVAESGKFDAAGIKMWYKKNDPKEGVIMGKIWGPSIIVSETVNLTNILGASLEEVNPTRLDAKRKVKAWGLPANSLTSLLLKEHVKELSNV
jgi:hypothetical protein